MAISEEKLKEVLDSIIEEYKMKGKNEDVYIIKED